MCPTLGRCPLGTRLHGYDVGSVRRLELKRTRRCDEIEVSVESGGNWVLKGNHSHRSSHHGGAVAQLGERVNGIDEVRGSNPLSSTKSDPFQNPRTFLVFATCG